MKEQMEHYKMKFIDGSPVPEAYARVITKMINDACDDDPGEEMESYLNDDDEVEGQFKILKGESI